MPLIRQKDAINEVQFAFMPGLGIAEAFFRRNNLSENLDKVFDRVPRDAVWWALRKLSVEEWLVKNVRSIYRNA